jgi:DNA-binding NtrC family response regulator
MTELWIVDDEPRFSLGLQEALESENTSVKLCPTIAALRNDLSVSFPDIVLLDQRLPDGLGTDNIPIVLQVAPDARIILMTAYGEADIIVQAIKKGAFNYIDKPFPIAGAKKMVQQAEESLALMRKSRENALRPSSHLTCGSVAMKKITDTIEKLKGQKDLNLLLLGESGAGKDVVARAIHEACMAQGSFIAINCAAIPESLLETELFGYRKGAYTGADGDKTGLIELANSGTLFLDEIGEMSLPLQSKLLRFLDNRALRPIGASAEKTVSLNIICATSVNLANAVANGTFRKDLYYRISIIPITVPPLRERNEDILGLASYFIQEFARKRKKPPRKLSEDTASLFLSYKWPGNVRELKNLIERLIILSTDGDEPIRLKDLPEEMLPDALACASGASGSSLDVAPGASLPERAEAFERECLLAALEKYGQNRCLAAESLGISRFSLLRRLQKHKLA